MINWNNLRLCVECVFAAEEVANEKLGETTTSTKKEAYIIERNAVGQLR